MPSIDSSKALSAFRQQYNGAAMLVLLAKHGGRMLVCWSVGVGKSFNIDQVIEHAIRSGRYDLILVLAPTRRILNERAWIKRPPQDVKVVNLRPRPSQQCGAYDDLWQEYERNHLGSLGRQDLCNSCGNRSGCFWPEQYGSGLTGAQVVFATQTHLEVSPLFLLMTAWRCKASSALVILDEANFIMKPAQRRIGREQLLQLQHLIQARIAEKASTRLLEWDQMLQVLPHTISSDLQGSTWHFPFLSSDEITILQAMGRDRWGQRYNFIGYELQLLGRSIASSREIDSEGRLCFSVYPQIPGDFLIYSGATDHRLAQHRLGSRFASPFANHRFFHPGTHWYNIASRIGAKKYFHRNSAQVFDFFVVLVAQRLAAGKRVLLVAKKQFLPFCRDVLQRQLRQQGLSDAQVVIATDQLAESTLQQSNCVPIINFGMIGTNRFEQFDCCYCLTGFYVDEQTLHDTVQDLYRADIQLTLEVGLQGQPLRRFARVMDRRHRFTEVDHLAQAALDHLEMGCVVQAVGRVRPYTQPREIITFQCAAHPEGAYEHEFQTLGEARAFFDIPDRRTRTKQRNQEQVQQCKSRGLTQMQTVAATDLSLSTVKRRWHRSGGCHGSS